MMIMRRTKAEEDALSHEQETEETLDTLRTIAATMAATSRRLNQVIDQLSSEGGED